DTFDAMHGNVFKHTLKIEDGYVYAPDRPGLGIELNGEFLSKYRVG
ncbi:MAG: mandelate racemase/muconate lactonizing enzyme family protein, partial [Chloroflexi bacterium]|nr:mandelate racemase/muconate lactonizing enzyme family protein [Chloroflexota bacterium]